MSLVGPRKVSDRLERSLAVARRGKDPEGVHQARVACRRLRVWLSLSGHEALDADLTWLAKGLGPLRDLDVLCEGPLAEDGPFSAFLEAERAAAQRQAKVVWEAPRVRALVKALEALPPASSRAAKRERARLEKKVRRGVRRLGAARKRPVGEQVERAHELRRDLRRLRYAREWLGEDVKGFSEVQDALGALCDVAALERHVQRYGAQGHPDAAAMRRRLERALGELLALLHQGLGAAVRRCQ